MNDMSERTNSFPTQPLVGGFLGIGDKSYLYTGAHSPALGSVAEAISEAYSAKSEGARGRDVLAAWEERARRALARLGGSSDDAVGLLGDASTAWSAVANGWEWRPGDNIVLNVFEHPSVYAPWLRMAPWGLTTRFVPHDADFGIGIDALIAACDERTTAIAISHVGYVTGLRHDLARLSQEADRLGIPLLVDFSHSLGVLPIDQELCAIGISASYKWTLGPYGVGIVYWNRERLPDFRPGAVGWRSTENIFTANRFEKIDWHADARRFQMGAPSYAGIAGLACAAETIVSAGISRVESHALSLSAAAHDRLVALGIDVISPRDDAARSGNVAFRHPDGEAFARRLQEQGILVWGGDQRVRASFHVMNTIEDVDHLTEGVASVVRELPGRAAVERV